jgi:hypothetical protein
VVEVANNNNNDPNEYEYMAGSNFSLAPLRCSFQDDDEDQMKVSQTQTQQKKMVHTIILTGQPKLL